MTTTIKDLGLNNKEGRDIPFFYAFQYKFWFQQDQLAPDDVLTWCRANAEGYYKVVGYTFKDSIRILVEDKENADKLEAYVEAHPAATPDELVAFCQKTFTDGYRVVPYNKKIGERLKERMWIIPGRRVYVDKIYLSNQDDAAKIKLHFEVSDQQVKRADKLKQKRAKRKK